MSTTVALAFQMSERDPFLCRTNATPPKKGWLYRDFRPMSNKDWRELLDFLGADNIIPVSADVKHIPLRERRRAQLWISPEAYKKVREELGKISH
jgi:hypothetical protein